MVLEVGMELPSGVVVGLRVVLVTVVYRDKMQGGNQRDREQQGIFFLVVSYFSS